MAKNYGDIFNEAVDTIIEGRLQALNFDTTEVCTIVDDSKREQGLYRVSNGSAEFDAYSESAKYRINNVVYVTIPKGDMNEQKFITGKRTKEQENDPFIYVNPFSVLVDITNNIVSNSYSDGIGLLANDEGTAERPDETFHVLWSKDENTIDLNGYTRLGIQAQFHAPIGTFQAESNGAKYIATTSEGEYGLRLVIVAKPSMTQTQDEANPDEERGYVYELNTDVMIGNPYQFNGYYQQEMVFDISEIGIIKSARLEFYQKTGSFKDKEGNARPHIDEYGNFFANNIFVKDIYVCMGYDTREFDEEKVIVYTLDSETYSSKYTYGEGHKNHKELQLRWIHKINDTNYISVDQDDELDYQVYWYRFQHGHASADQYSGIYWKPLTFQNSINKEIRQFYGIETDGATYLDGLYEERINDLNKANQDWISYNSMYPSYKKEPEFFKTWLLPDNAKEQERVKAIIIYNGKVIRSNELIINNEDSLLNSEEYHKLHQALNIFCEDQTYGNYLLYNAGNQLVDYSQRAVLRYLKADFIYPGKTEQDVLDSELSDIELQADWIEWKIPKKKTMLKWDISLFGKEENKTYQYTIDDSNEEYDLITFKANEQNHVYRRLPYYINAFYSQQYYNNIIACRISYMGQIYETSKELTFGRQRTVGTDVAFVIDFDENITAITAGDNQAVTVTARLYDYNNDEIDISDNSYQIEWGWKTSTPSGMISRAVAENKTKRELQFTGSLGENYAILQATLKGWGSRTELEVVNKITGEVGKTTTAVDLVAYLPIPIRLSAEYLYLSGPNTIMYDSAGYLSDFYQIGYKLVKTDGTELSNSSQGLVMSIVNSTDPYLPKITTNFKTNNYELQPLSIYVEDANDKVCLQAKVNNILVWSQPILIYQNRYPSRMLDEWDGTLVVDEENGAIMSSKIAAGKKDLSTNTFTGVILGDWAESRVADGSTQANEYSIAQHTGLYGFNKGKQTYGFRDNGTAFIGESGSGRIEFDGTNSYIQSAGYTSGMGMRIDLLNNSIDAKDNFTLSASERTAGNYLSLTTTTYPDGYAFEIGNNFKVLWDGSATVNNITAVSGKIGPWNLNNTGFFSDGSATQLLVDGTLKMGGLTISPSPSSLDFGSGRLYIDSSGFYINKDTNYESSFTSSGIDLQGRLKITPTQITVGVTDTQPVIINNNSVSASSFNIYQAKSNNSENYDDSTYCGTIGYLESNDKDDGIVSGGVGIKSAKGAAVLKVNDETIGLTTSDAQQGIFIDILDESNSRGGIAQLYSNNDTIEVGNNELGISIKSQNANKIQLNAQDTYVDGALHCNLFNKRDGTDKITFSAPIEISEGNLDLTNGNLKVTGEAQITQILTVDDIIKCNKFVAINGDSIAIETPVTVTGMVLNGNLEATGTGRFNDVLTTESIANTNKVTTNSLEVTGGTSACIGVYATLA